MRTFVRSKATLLFIVCAALLAIPAIALADIVADSINDVSTSVGSKTTVAGDPVVVGYRIQNQNTNAGDTQNSCNPADGTAANLAFNVTNVTATPNPLVINACSNTFSNATFNSEKAGSYTITPQVTDAGGGVYQTSPATWSLTVNKAKTQLTGVSGAGVSGTSNGHVQATLSSFKTDGTTVNKPLDGKTVTFKIDGNTVGTDVTDVNGLAELNNVNLSGVTAGGHNLTAEFAQSVADDGYLASTGNGPMSVAPPPDSSPPQITKTITGTSGSNGWYKSSVTVQWTVTDPDSAVVIDSGCGTQNFTSNTASATSSCTAHSAGGSASDSVTLKIDKDAPTVTADADRPADHNGWYNAPLTVSFSGTDVGPSGNVSCDANVTYGNDPGETDGTGKSVSGSCTDDAGNSANATYNFDYDNTDPTATATPNHGPDHNGWYNAPFTVNFSGTDTTSGPVSCSPASTIYGNDPGETDGTGKSVSSTCSDDAGNSANATYNFDYDNTDPTVTVSLSRAADHNGWYNQAVDYSVSAKSDVTSGIDSCQPLATYSGPDSQNASVSRTCTDLAGNTGSGSANFKYDDTVPTLNPSVSPNPVVVNGPATASPGANDATSLIDTANTGCDPVNTNTIGASQTVSCHATDNAGNTNTANATYDVQGTFNGFLQPIDGHTVNTGKYGRTYPIKWQLRDSSGALISDSAAQALVANMSGGQKSVTCGSFNLLPTDALEESTTGSTSLRYDATSDQFIYNYKAPSSGSCYIFAIRGVDGVAGVNAHTEQIDFQFTK